MPQLRQDLSRGASPAAIASSTASKAHLLMAGAAADFSQQVAADALAMGIRSMAVASLPQAQVILQAQSARGPRPSGEALDWAARPLTPV